jgi:hypothetical protein
MPGRTEPYLREKFSIALSSLAASTGTLPERVRNAMVTLVMFGPEDMPDRYSREAFARLLYLTTDREAEGEEGQLAATLDNMEVYDVGEFAQIVVDLHSHLLRRTDAAYAAQQEPSAPA